MKVATAGITLALFTTSLCSALPPTKKERVHDLPLSDKEHTLNGEHNEDYDHDAFLGKGDADEYDQLSPEESKKRLGKLVDKIDGDGNGFVTEEELIHWIQHVQRKYVTDDTERMWNEHDVDGDTLTWESYRKRTYGYEHEPEDDESYKDMIDKDKRKFNAADSDKDGKLSKDEFAAFLHPEEMEHMKDIVVLETIEDIDKDKDGFISLDEYIADMMDDDDDDDDDDDEDEDQSWKESEKDQFRFYRDTNGDGRLDHEEVKHWIMPDDYDNSEAESKHLMLEADEDKDGKLSKEEILEKYDIFVGSQATEFGEALTRHEEF